LTDWFHVALTILVLFVVTNFWLVYRVLRPLRKLALQTADLSRGNLAALQQPCGGIPEIGILQRTMASMAAHVRRSHDDGLAYRHALTDGQEAERARIAHELHDDTIQSLVAIAQSLDFASNLIEKDSVRAAAMLKTARQQAVEAIEGLRRLIANLRPPALEELGLIPALRMLAESESGAEVKVRTTGIERRLQAGHELALFRVAQEAIHNAQRHGQATRISVEVDYQLQRVRLSTCDNGVGFLPPENLDQLARTGHYGLLGMQERIQHLNGTIQIVSAPDSGTNLVVELPLDKPDQPTETVKDPVCGARIKPQQAYGSVRYEGEKYYFCCPVCQGAFQQNAETYLAKLN
jgi:signal transduction histidine kinase/YHS domain-containing protein